MTGRKVMDGTRQRLYSDLMSIRLEIHPSEGGADAVAFAAELAQAVSKHSGAGVAAEGRVLVLDRL